MEIVKTADHLTKKISAYKKAGKSIGFVPTMGALHQGHLSLLSNCQSMNDISVVSIFVNPTQFNDPADLKRYPRNLDKDLELLTLADCNLAFCPDEHEIYPEPDGRVFDFGGLDKVMEGRFRPGHFNGVAQVVSRLLDIVQPHRMYLGIKDFQQVAIIRRMIRHLGYAVETIACPTIREEDGLALSSRNALLNREQRLLAALIPQTLHEAGRMASSRTVSEVKLFVAKKLGDRPGITLEYFEIVDENTLEPVSEVHSATGSVGCIAVRIGDIRLIDNMYFSL